MTTIAGDLRAAAKLLDDDLWLAGKLLAHADTIAAQESELARLHARVAELEAAEPVAWLHDVVQGDDNEPDQALSFSPDNFPLMGDAPHLFRSVSCQPLFTRPAPKADAWDRCDACNGTLDDHYAPDQGGCPGFRKTVPLATPPPPRGAGREALRDALTRTTAHLMAAADLLRRIHDDVPKSKRNALFSTMVSDYEAVAELGRRALAGGGT